MSRVVLNAEEQAMHNEAQAKLEQSARLRAEGNDLLYRVYEMNAARTMREALAKTPIERAYLRTTDSHDLGIA